MPDTNSAATETPALFDVGNAHEGMPAAGGEGIAADSAREAAEIYVAGGEWHGASEIEVAVCRLRASRTGPTEREQPETIAVNVAAAQARWTKYGTAR